MKKYVLILILFAYIGLYASATQISIRIVDIYDNPIPYVVIKGLSGGQTDNLGRATIPIEETTPDSTLYTFTRLGYKQTQKPLIDLKNNHTIVMEIEPYETEAIYVVTESIPQPFRMTSDSERIDLTEIDKVYSTVDDILKDIPQISIRGVRLAGEQQTLALGGHHGRHTIVMLDNVVLNPSGQAVDLSSIPASQITSIEVVKNNASVEAGSGGIAGMIILHTKNNNRTNQAQYNFGLGSFGSVKNNLGFDFYHKNLGLNMNISHLYAENNFEYKYLGEKQKRKHNKKDILNLTTDIRYYYDQYSFTYNFRFQDYYKGLPGPINQEQRYLKAFQEGTTMHNTLLFSDKNFDLQLYHIQNNSVYNNTDAPITMFHAKDKNIHSLQGLKVSMKKEINILTSTLGYELKGENYLVKDKLYDRNSIPSTNQSTMSLFTSQKIKYDFFYWVPEVIGSFRFDENSEFHTHESWRAELNQAFYTIIPFKIKSSIGTSYTIPSFYDLYWKGDSQTTGNPDLKPEESFGWRIEGFTDTNPSIGIAKWNNKTENLIYWIRSVTGWKPFNVAKAENDVIEFYGNYIFLKNQTISFNYTTTDARNKTKGYLYDKYIVYTPESLFNAQLNIYIYGVNQIFSYTAQGRQWSTIDQLIPPIKGYDLFDTHTSWKFRIWKLETNYNFSIYNLFDKRYQNYEYIPEPGIAWEGQIGVKYVW